MTATAKLFGAFLLLCGFWGAAVCAEEGGSKSSGDDVVDHSGIARALMEDALGVGGSGGAGDAGPGGGARGNRNLGEQAWGDNTVTVDGRGNTPEGDTPQGMGFWAAAITAPSDKSIDKDMAQNEPIAAVRSALYGDVYEQMERDEKMRDMSFEEKGKYYERQAREIDEVNKFDPESIFQPTPRTSMYQTDMSKLPEALGKNPQWMKLDRAINDGQWHKSELSRMREEINNRADLSPGAREAMLKKVEDARARVQAKQEADEKEANRINDARIKALRPGVEPEPYDFSPNPFTTDNVRESMTQSDQAMGRESMGREAIGEMPPPAAASGETGHEEHFE